MLTEIDQTPTMDGRMMQGDASALHKGGWSFKLDEGERVRAIAGATVLESQLLGIPARITPRARRLSAQDRGCWQVLFSALTSTMLQGFNAPEQANLSRETALHRAANEGQERSCALAC